MNESGYFNYPLYVLVLLFFKAKDIIKVIAVIEKINIKYLPKSVE